MNIVQDVQRAAYTAMECPNFGRPTFLYLGIYEYHCLQSYARQNLQMFVTENVEHWGKEMFLGMEVVPVDKYSWLKVGS